MEQSDELREYLQKSRQGRRELVDKADEYIKPTIHMNSLSVSSNPNLEFPKFTPKRLMDFKEQVNSNLKLVFTPNKPQNLPKIPVLRSISKEDNYKKIYLTKTKPTSRRTKSGTYSLSSDKKPVVALLPKSYYKKQYLSPLLVRFS